MEDKIAQAIATTGMTEQQFAAAVMTAANRMTDLMADQEHLMVTISAAVAFVGATIFSVSAVNNRSPDQLIEGFVEALQRYIAALETDRDRIKAEWAAAEAAAKPMFYIQPHNEEIA